MPTLGGTAWLLLALGLAALAWRGRQGMRMNGRGMGGSAPLGLLGAITLGTLGMGAPPPAHAGSAVIAPPPGTAAAPGQIVRAEFTQTAPGAGLQVRITVRKTGAAGPAKLPHTGTRADQCYRAGSNDLVACDSPEAIALSGAEKQDGMRRHINPLSYSAVPKPGGGHYDKTECVKDNNTGLIWEGKLNQSGHLRHYENRYTNLDSNQPGDASAYVAAVNALGLCGFNDWRLPTVRELQGLVDYSKSFSGPTISPEWFKNSPSTWFWTNTIFAEDSNYAWTVDFFYGRVGSFRTGSRIRQNSVRLVRSAS